MRVSVGHELAPTQRLGTHCLRDLEKLTRFCGRTRIRPPRGLSRSAMSKNETATIIGRTKNRTKLPESDREDREVFLSHIRQLLAVLGSELLIPVAKPAARQQSGGIRFCRMEGAEGSRSSHTGWLCRSSRSTALLHERQWAKRCRPGNQLITNDTLIQKDGFYQFTKDVGFLVQGGRSL